MYSIGFIATMAAVGFIAVYILLQLVRCCFEKEDCTVSCVLPKKK
jgi:hypothetical protein